MKALVVFSGGLDSILAVRILQNAGIKVSALTFVSAFFDEKKAIQSAKNLGIEIFIENFTEKHLEIVKNPPHGYGKNLNPCIDCHALMFRIAGEISKKKNFDFIATGEVLGQRPFSQNKNALRQIEKIAGLEILRPLSAKLLPETEIEKMGKVDRSKLYDFSGRSRKPQLKLAKEFGINKFETPAGGCILTDPSYSIRGKTMLKIHQEANENDFKILRYGRFFPLDNAVLIIGRNHTENEELKNLAQKGDILITITNYPSPIALLRSFNENKDYINFAKEKTLLSTPKAKGKNDVEYEITQQ